MRLISHRGAAGLGAENSLESIKLAEKFKPDFIEIDVNVSYDGVLVIHHGTIQKHIINAPLRQTFKQLKEIDHDLLTLPELLKQSLDTTLLLDIKTRNNTDEIIKVIKESGNTKVAFTSIFPKPLKELSLAFPEAHVFIAQPYQEGPFRAIQLATKYGFKGISLNKWWLGPIPYHMCKRANLEMVVYTIDNPVVIRLVSKLFPRIYLCTNRPDRYHRLLKQ